MHHCHYNVVVIGGGNAALCAAICASKKGATVVIIEHAPRSMRGGNSRHTRNLRLAHEAPTDVLTGRYLVDEYLQDLLKVTAGKTTLSLSKLLLETSKELSDWMYEHGVRFQPSLSGTLSLGRTNAFFLGGGKALVNAYYLTAEDLGVDVVYEAEATGLEVYQGNCRSVDVSIAGTDSQITCDAVVVASGGFQANDAWLREAWGPAADNFLIRGTPFNKGRMLAELLDKGCASVGDPTQAHMVAIDGRAPKYDGGISTRLDAVPFSIVVNKHGIRFYDEGEDFWPKRYAIWGRLVAQQPEQVAYVIIDSRSLELFMPSVFSPFESDTVEGLAVALGLEPRALAETIDTYNDACQPGSYDTASLNGPCTKGLSPEKTNWARAITEPPFYGYKLRPGVTFTYLGVEVNERAKVMLSDGTPSQNIYAAGEIMAGNILGQGYLAGTGMTIGTVFGRIAGTEAASHGQ